MNVVKLLGEATQLTNTADNIDSGERILLQHNHAGGNAHLVTIKNSGGTVLGSVYVAPHRPIVVQKERTDTCLLYTSPSPRDGATSRMPSSA